MQQYWWGYWSDYPKVTIGGRVYAQIGNRFYTEHAIERLQPSGRRTVRHPPAHLEGGGFSSSKGRSISPYYVEDVICRGLRQEVKEEGISRVRHTSGDVWVVTENEGQIVVSVGYKH